MYTPGAGPPPTSHMVPSHAPVGWGGVGVPSLLGDSGACLSPVDLGGRWSGLAGMARLAGSGRLRILGKRLKPSKSPEKQAPPHPRNPRPYHGGGEGAAADGAYLYGSLRADPLDPRPNFSQVQLQVASKE